MSRLLNHFALAPYLSIRFGTTWSATPLKSLKAYLSLFDMTMVELMVNGHNLESILRVADEKLLSRIIDLSTEQRAAVCNATEYYNGKVFEYPAVGEALSGYPALPDFEMLMAAASMLVDSLAEPCKRAE